MTLCFDRGGWSPELFADIIDARFDLLTYRKNEAGKDIPALPAEAFSHGQLDRRRRPQHASTTSPTRTVDLAISEGGHKGRVLALRQVTRRKPGRGGAPPGRHPDHPPRRATCPPPP